MRHAGNFNPEWGYLAPAPTFLRTTRVFIVAAACRRDGKRRSRLLADGSARGRDVGCGAHVGFGQWSRRASAQRIDLWRKLQTQSRACRNLHRRSVADAPAPRCGRKARPSPRRRTILRCERVGRCGDDAKRAPAAAALAELQGSWPTEVPPGTQRPPTKTAAAAAPEAEAVRRAAHRAGDQEAGARGRAVSRVRCAAIRRDRAMTALRFDAARSLRSCCVSTARSVRNSDAKNTGGCLAVPRARLTPCVGA